MVTVGYEQAIGRRETGQNCYGEFTANVTKTLAGDLDSALTAWQSRIAGVTEFRKVPLAAEPRVSSTDKWRYWRASLADGSQVNVNIGVKAPGKVGLAVEHSKLADDETASAWKAYWKEFLGGVAA
jgi:hypothetical protein